MAENKGVCWVTYLKSSEVGHASGKVSFGLQLVTFNHDSQGSRPLSFLFSGFPYC